DELERLCVCLAVNGETELISAGKSLRAGGLARHIQASNRGHAVFGLSDRRRRVANVPDEPVHPSSGGERIGRLKPICRECRWRWWTEWLVFTGVRTDNLSLCIQHFKFYFIL